MRIPLTLYILSRNLLIILAFIVYGSSCSKLITDDFPAFEEIPVINAVLISGDTIYAHISLSGSIDTTEIKYIDNAEVIINSSLGEVDSLKLLAKGLYISDLIAKEGVNYCLEVRIEGIGKVFGSDSIPFSVSAKIIDHTNYYRYDEEGNFTEGIEIQFYDNPNTTDYYEIALIKKEHSNANYVYPFAENSIIILNEGIEPYTTPTLVIRDEQIQDSIVRLFLDFHQGYHLRNYGDSLVQIFDEHTIELEFRHISENYYNYKKHFYLYLKDRFPGFIEGTASYYQNYSNVENGLGIIGAYSVTRDSIWIPEEHLLAR